MLVVYDASGRILFISTYHAADDYEEALTDQGQMFIRYDEQCDASEIVSTHYVNDGALKQRPIINVSHTEAKVGDRIKVSGLHGKATIQIDDEEYLVEGEALTFEADHPGEYMIKVDAWPCLPFETKVIVE